MHTKFNNCFSTTSARPRKAIHGVLREEARPATTAVAHQPFVSGLWQPSMLVERLGGMPKPGPRLRFSNREPLGHASWAAAVRQHARLSREVPTLRL